MREPEKGSTLVEMENFSINCYNLLVEISLTVNVHGDFVHAKLIYAIIHVACR